NNIAANVSPLQFRQPHFVEQVQSIIREFDITPALLKLEITESTVIDNVEEIIQKMHKLKSFGLHFSMDDFGTGYSSLSYLRKLPLDQLKIDQSFVHDITTDKSDAMIVETIISMGHHLGLDVIAEGVESDQEIQFLHENGCNSYQGYFCSKPIPANEFEQLIIAQNITPK
ncbi:MAG: EAL domain-containing protein, partial [Methylococcales bacterium]|nr:EAL domain-containing protein [Methylococcales bacterium]